MTDGPAETNGMSRVAFFGLGIMGWPMAANLTKAGFETKTMSPQ